MNKSRYYPEKASKFRNSDSERVRGNWKQPGEPARPNTVFGTLRGKKNQVEKQWFWIIKYYIRFWPLQAIMNTNKLNRRKKDMGSMKRRKNGKKKNEKSQNLNTQKKPLEGSQRATHFRTSPTRIQRGIVISES